MVPPLSYKRRRKEDTVQLGCRIHKDLDKRIRELADELGFVSLGRFIEYLLLRGLDIEEERLIKIATRTFSETSPD